MDASFSFGAGDIDVGHTAHFMFLSPNRPDPPPAAHYSASGVEG